MANEVAEPKVSKSNPKKVDTFHDVGGLSCFASSEGGRSLLHAHQTLPH